MQPLNSVTIKGAIKKVAQFIQDEKVDISKTTIGRLQNTGYFGKEYYSWVSSKSPSNLYKDPDKFFTIMKATPAAFGKDFFFSPIENATDDIKKAVKDAIAIINRKTREYISAPNVTLSPNITTGLLISNYEVRVAGGNNITSVSQLDSLGPQDIVQIYNPIEYASKAEVNALYYAKTQGIMYYAAQMVSRAYPSVGVKFGWVNGTLLKGVSHNKDVPLLQIGPRALVADSIQKPGVNLRRDPRRKHRRSDRG